METDWIEQARRGDEVAFQHLIEAHQEAAFRLAYLMLKNRQDAEDITQEAFWRAYTHLHQFDASRPFQPWLLKITANLCRNQRRAGWRYWQAVGNFFQREVEHEQTPSVERTVVQSLEVASMLTAIQQLRHDEQEIIYLRYFLEMDTAATAEILNIATGTVKSRLHRALQHLESIIEGEFPVLVEHYED
jgi:RNA polymerase sigma-70 factor, ECF subfamily